MNVFYLYKSKVKNKKYTMVMPQYNHRHNFGDSRYRDFTLISDTNSKYYLPNREDREKVKKAYRNRHKKDKGLKSIHAPSELSMVILWSEPTLNGGIKGFENKHNVRVIKMF